MQWVGCPQDEVDDAVPGHELFHFAPRRVFLLASRNALVVQHHDLVVSWVEEQLIRFVRCEVVGNLVGGKAHCTWVVEGARWGGDGGKKTAICRQKTAICRVVGVKGGIRLRRETCSHQQ